MAHRLTMPLSILMLCYLMIVGFCLIIICLSFLIAYDLNHYLKNKTVSDKNCRSYLEINDYENYQKCVSKLISFIH
ncbi:MAG TPA: hypothetical protein PKZ16_02045 [bacterium]|nr:hypothetical protein [bacterium]HPL95846.1 hypothetical protein [bacterium]